jgi:hypothetical protein
MKKRFLKLFAAVLAISMVFSLAACGGTAEETSAVTTTEPPVISKTPQPQSVAEVLNYFNTVMDSVKTDKPAVAPKVSKNVGSIETENAKLKAAIPTIKKYMLNTKADGAALGDDLTNIFPVKGQAWSSKLSVNDVRYASCLEALKTYEITIRFKDETDPLPLTSSIGKAFDITEKASILKEFEKAADYIKVDSLSLVYTGCYIRCTVDRATDQVLSVTYILNVNADSSVTGTGSLDDMGTVPLKMRYDSTVSYELTWTEPEA